jgi:hypothetical protein
MTALVALYAALLWFVQTAWNGVGVLFFFFWALEALADRSAALPFIRFGDDATQARRAEADRNRWKG